MATEMVRDVPSLLFGMGILSAGQCTAVLSFLMKQSQGIEALQMLIGGFVIFMIPQVVGSVVVFLELAAATIRQVWYI